MGCIGKLAGPVGGRANRGRTIDKAMKAHPESADIEFSRVRFYLSKVMLRARLGCTDGREPFEHS